MPMKQQTLDHYFIPPVPILYDRYSTEELDQLLDISLPAEALFPTGQTYYVMDISSQQHTAYNSILFQLDDAPKKSMESTAAIMTRYFESRQLPYRSMQKFGNTLGHFHCLPYLYGDTCFVPDRGASKQSASWYALHHMTDVYYASDQSATVLYHHQYPLLNLSLKKATFKKQLSVACDMLRVQNALADHILLLYPQQYIKVQQPPDNLIQKELLRTSFQAPPLTFFEYLDYMIYFKVQHVLTGIFGVDNPYLEEAREGFRKPKFMDRFPVKKGRGHRIH
ncbi:hypothetical protein ADIAL_1261 [Alkalibacterium sp. AK22]|nr:hypothetical protein ADIAL_1261 [Alkalibacterium sp. AK22]